MKLRRCLLIALFATSIAAPAIAAWCSGGDGKTWNIECWNSGCTISFNEGKGVWKCYDVDRAWGDIACD